LFYTCFCLRPPRPPLSTLLPYTTLFRSLGEDRRANAGARSGEREARGGSASARGGAAPAREIQREDPRPRLSGRSDGTAEPAAADRKSTRLNSSHVKISYAVFCLKKKTK